MTKIYTKIVFEWDSANDRYIKTESEHYEYDGNIALCGGSSGGGGSGSTSMTTTSVPWSEQIPYLEQGFSTAKNLFLDSPPPSYFPGSTVTPFSAEKNTALDLQSLRAVNGSPQTPISNIQNLATMAGSYLPSQNPFNQTLNQQYDTPTNSAQYQALLNSQANQIRPAVDSAFENSGRLNSGLAQEARTKAIADAFAGNYMQDKGLTAQDRAYMGQNYSNERQNMVAATMYAPQLANQDYTDISQLGNAGDMRDALNQQYTADNVNRYNYNQNIMQQQLEQYMPLIQGTYGGTTTSNGTSSTANQLGGGGFGSILGAGMAGMNLGSTMGIGSMLGGGLGILGGFL